MMNSEEESNHCSSNVKVIVYFLIGLLQAS